MSNDSLPGLTRKVSFMPRQAFLTIPARFARELNLRENPYVNISCDGTSLTITPVDGGVVDRIHYLEEELTRLKKSVGLVNSLDEEEDE